MKWPAAFLMLLLTACTIPPPKPPPASPSPTVALMPPELPAPRKRFAAPAPVVIQPPVTRIWTIPLHWDTNQLKGKTAFDLQESHDRKTWVTIQTNVYGDPWVTNSTGALTFWRVQAR